MTKIEIDLADLGLRYDGEDQAYQATMQDLIVEAAAARILDRETIIETRNKIGRKVDEVVAEKVEAMVTEALAEPIQRTSPWGERKGEPTTVREIIREKVEAYFNNPGRRDRYSSDPKNLTELIENEVGRALTADMQKTVKEAKAKVHETVTQRALAAAVAELSR